MSGGALDASITLDELLTVVGSKRVALAPELAGYLALEIAEQADPNGGNVDSRSIFVSEEGTVALVRPKRDPAIGDAEASIRDALARLLEASGAQTPSLTVASRRKNGAGLAALSEELEAALIPVNRAAGRRALARLAREVRRVTLGIGRHTLPSSSAGRASQRESVRQPAASTFSREEDPTTTRSKIPSELLEKGKPATWNEMPTTEFAPGARAPSPSETDVDALIAEFGVTGSGDQQHARALRAMVGIEPTPAAPPNAPVQDPSLPSRNTKGADDEADLEAFLALQDAVRPTASQITQPRARERLPPTGSQEPHESGTSSTDLRQMPTRPSQLKKSRASLPSPARAPLAPSRSLLAALALVALAAGGYAVWKLRAGALGEHRAPVGSDTQALMATALPPQDALRSCLGTLVVTDVPARAEVLLREGQAPIDIGRMPVGARLEFVATAEGYSPKRVVVPAGGGWDVGPDGRPRFEAAVQLDPSRSHAGSGDSWPAGEPGSEVGGQGPPGTVHVVATPRGSEVWMLAGIGPEARIEQVQCDQDIDVLVAGPTTYRKRLRVVEGDFVVEGTAGIAKVQTRVARVSAR